MKNEYAIAILDKLRAGESIDGAVKTVKAWNSQYVLVHELKEAVDVLLKAAQCQQPDVTAKLAAAEKMREAVQEVLSSGDYSVASCSSIILTEAMQAYDNAKEKARD